MDQSTHILIKGAREHNLKNLSANIPKNKLVVFTGVSGSGKSSLAFDTIYAEGQRRYIESLSAYARQFLGQMEKPKYDSIKGLSPTIAIEQKSASKNPRSTVGTITEIYDYLRVLYARVGIQYCVKCSKKVEGGDLSQALQSLKTLQEGTKLQILAPCIVAKKGEHRDKITALIASGFTKARVNGVFTDLDQIGTLAKHKKHTIEALVDRLVFSSSKELQARLREALEAAAKISDGFIIVQVDGHESTISLTRSCCGIAYPKLDPPLFSFNSPLGMCQSCQGLGQSLGMDEKKILAHPSLSIRQGAVKPWASLFGEQADKKPSKNNWSYARLLAMEKQWGLDLDTPWKQLPKTIRDRILYGSSDPKHDLVLKWSGQKSQGSWKVQEDGLINRLFKKYHSSQSERVKSHYAQYLSVQKCQECSGHRIKSQMLAVRIQGLGIHELCALNIQKTLDFVATLNLEPWQQKIASELLKEIKNRLSFLINVGLEYLSLDRLGPTLSGGEAQRIRLASQIGSELTGVLYVLDEPSIGLHQRDNEKLISTLENLRDLGNSLIVVEHDEEMIRRADWVLDFGPKAGSFGGRIIYQGEASGLLKDLSSETAAYLNHQKSVSCAFNRKVDPKTAKWLEIKGASANNLQNLDVALPLGRLVLITGVSGAGKSSLINEVLIPSLVGHFDKKDQGPVFCDKILGLEHIDKFVQIDQSPIGRTPRSNPATYTKLFDLIRDLFAKTPQAQVRGYLPGRFSFNVPSGRCESCEGDGVKKIEMHFLADVFVECHMCKGRRFNDATLEVLYKDHSIADVLNLSVLDARKLFEHQIKMTQILDTLIAVGLDYISLGQPATTLSGGEAQRIKLSKELAKKDTGRTLYILDEPTTGLHFSDCRKLLEVLQDLVQRGNTVVVIEHNIDVIKSADWIIDLGPNGGLGGGQIVAKGTVSDVSASKYSYTGKYLRS